MTHSERAALRCAGADFAAADRWWADQETRIGGTFRNDRPSYAAMLAQPDLFKDTQTDDLIECFCHD